MNYAGRSLTVTTNDVFSATHLITVRAPRTVANPSEDKWQLVRSYGGYSQEHIACYATRAEACEAAMCFANSLTFPPLPYAEAHALAEQISKLAAAHGAYLRLRALMADTLDTYAADEQINPSGATSAQLIDAMLACDAANEITAETVVTELMYTGHPSFAQEAKP